MRGVILVAVGAASLAIGGFIALKRAASERARSGEVTVPTVIAAFVAYLGPSVCALLASWWSAWPLPFPRGLAFSLGGALLVSGLAGYSAARREFHLLRRAWGMRTDQLITTGPYAYSRNPQLIGWALVLLGTAVAGRSSAALALTAIYWMGCVFTIRAEEQALERVFGNEYRRHRAAVPRYIGLPATKRPGVSSPPMKENVGQREQTLPSPRQDPCFGPPIRPPSARLTRRTFKLTSGLETTARRPPEWS